VRSRVPMPSSRSSARRGLSYAALELTRRRGDCAHSEDLAEGTGGQTGIRVVL
jgi:hypothetical protein